jgi:hypothetical protein
MDFDRIGAVGLQNGKAPSPMPIDVTKMRCLTERQWNVRNGAIRQTRRGCRDHIGHREPRSAPIIANLFGADDG